MTSTLPELIRHRMRSTPDAVAIVAGDTEVTYRDLGRRVRAVVGGLRKLGAGRGTTVAVALPHGIEQVTVLLALTEAGATYLPVDVDLPAERIRHMVGDARPCCVVASDDLRNGPAGALIGAAARVVGVGELTTSTAPPDDRPGGPVADDVAYVIYTSGSTGRPKGVAVSHAAVVNNLVWVQRRYGLRVDDRVLHKTPLGFDVSVWELLWPLVTGAALVIADPAIHKEPVALAELIERERITVAHFVPSMLDVFLDSATVAGSLRMVVLSGEAVPARLCRKFLEASSASLHNLYGPTEAAIHVTSWDCPRTPPDDTVPIGRPVDNTELYVLDQALRPVEPGGTGDLHIGGAQLALGYLNNAALTAGSFVANPFGPPGGRMYRTGDLARWDADGELQYLGRSDSQVKINGVRVEIGEVEAALERHPAVRQAAAVLARTASGEPYLSAVVTVDAGAAPGADRLIRLQELPEEVRPTILELAPGLPVCVPDEATARAAYQEVFEWEAYTRGGGLIPEGARIVDVGAGIGMFAMYASTRAPGVRVLAAEATPGTFDLLRQNMSLHAVDAVLLPYDLGAGAGRAHVPARTISQILDEEGIDRVDLLKIDAADHGGDPLAGVEIRHWPGIAQVCVKVAEPGADAMAARLTGHGFSVRSWRPPGGISPAVHLYGVRERGDLPQAGVAPVRKPMVSLLSLAEEIRARSATVLAPAMVPAKVRAVSQLPLTPNGKLDRARIASMAATAAPSSGRVAATERERILCDLIGAVVGAADVGPDDNVFQLGATSLAAVRLTAAVNKRFGVRLRLRLVVDNPTAAGLAQRLDEML
ncbi:amino acid adenylation domain-containing protein [Actinoplanes sp. NPDC049265]|uniref:amino acid adenylation domain-containing protein n=1 Tax=Actinoplanes sp. NPDC049265 TaxID=3363902 RepID=UPI00371A0668